MNAYRVEMTVTDGYAMVQVIDPETDAILTEQTDLTTDEAMAFVRRYIEATTSGHSAAAAAIGDRVTWRDRGGEERVGTVVNVFPSGTVLALWERTGGAPWHCYVRPDRDHLAVIS